MKVLGFTVKKVEDRYVLEICILKLDHGSMDPYMAMICGFGISHNIDNIFTDDFRLSPSDIKAYYNPKFEKYEHQVEGKENSKSKSLLKIRVYEYSIPSDEFHCLILLTAIYTYSRSEIATHVCFSDVSINDLAPLSRHSLDEYVAANSLSEGETTEDIHLVMCKVIERLQQLMADNFEYLTLQRLLTVLQQDTNLLTKFTKEPSSILNYLVPDVVVEPRYVSTVSTIRILTTLFRKYIANGQANALQFSLYVNQTASKRHLYESCIGLTANDKKKYSWNYTEWHLLEDAEFHIRPDGRMSIRLANNPTFKAIYAENGMLKPELEFLGELINLQFDHDCDFSSELIFTPKCTAYLVSLGLHHDQKYVAAIIYTWHIMTIFSKLWLSLGARFPKDVIFHMLDYVIKSIEEIKQVTFDKSEILALRQTIDWSQPSVNNQTVDLLTKPESTSAPEETNETSTDYIKFMFWKRDNAIANHANKVGSSRLSADDKNYLDFLEWKSNRVRMK